MALYFVIVATISYTFVSGPLATLLPLLCRISHARDCAAAPRNQEGFSCMISDRAWQEQEMCAQGLALLLMPWMVNSQQEGGTLSAQEKRLTTYWLLV
eukprot:657909-Pleurochrysis_carterae.AAC.2